MNSHALPALLVSLCLASTSLAATKDDPFAQNVRTTEPLAPAEQAKTFTLPPGFTITLVAAEPDINKPMNLAFDAKGRLWVTSTRLYPWPARSDAEKTDAIKVIELNGDGSARSVATFADGLDIPIGVLPLGDGRRALAYDIATVRLFTDTDGDGKADAREVLYSGFDHTRDTHGMASNFRRGFDGWVYACHGFNNVSNVRDKSGNVVHLRSGNTFRMSLDGSRVEPFTIGQINPFGMCFDPLGNVYTSDSHSKPIYQLLRGGRYEAFDRDTNDGLGLAPAMMQHLHNSTAIAGSQFYAARDFPEEFRGNVFVGNVVTSRINRDKLEYVGSTPRAVEQPDFVTTSDPWFRPVQTVLGPDGALYVADFYNRIIGHYEVDLKHPGRDFERGRIWRIAYAGDGGKPKGVSRFDFSNAGAPQLIERLGDANLTFRMLAMNELSDRIGADAIGPCLLAASKGSTFQKIHALWVLHRLHALELGTIATAAADKDAAVRVHAMRILSETPKWFDAQHMLAVEGLKDADPLVQRCAADALGVHPAAEHVRPLLALRHRVPAEDTHLLYVVRMALRNQLAIPGAIDAVAAGGADLTSADRKAIIDVIQAVPTPDAAAFLIEHLEEVADDDDKAVARVLRHGVRYADGRAIAPLVAVLRKRFAGDVDLQLELFAAVQKAAAERGEPLPPPARQWGADLARAALMPPPKDEESSWTALPLPGAAADAPSPWTLQQRVSRDGDRHAVFFSSLPLAEQYTGVLRSKPFGIPVRLSMYVAGHNGPPGLPDARKNVIRLRSAENDAVLVESFPPRHDTARPIVWDLKEHAGKRGYLEAVDADARGAYAWLAFGRLDPPVVPLPTASPAMIAARQRQAAEIAASLSLKEAAAALRDVMTRHGYDVATRTAAADALAKVDPDAFVRAGGGILGDASESMNLREKVAEALGSVNSEPARAALLDAFKTAPARLQTALAGALATTPQGAAALLDAIAASRAPATLLQQPKLVEKLAAAKVPDLEQRVKQLTRGLPAPQDAAQKLIEQRAAAFAAAKPYAAAGAAVFMKNCAQCHQLGGEGKVVGPQLDGVGNRGLERLIEDILDPNRNVDPAFRYSNVTLKDTTLITGLQKREEGETLVFVDTTGREVTVPKSQIRSRAESRLSIMPNNFGEIIPPEEFNQLLAYLMQSKPPPAK